MKKLLEVELVPSTSFFKNLRSDLKTAEWDFLRKETYKAAGYRCEICGGKGPKWPVECHEIWEYKDGVQKLIGLIALCPSCHDVVHIGLAEVRGNYERAVAHLMKVNGWTRSDADHHIKEKFDEWNQRSKQKWELDITWATKRLKKR